MRWKVIGVSAVLLGLLALQGVLSGKPVAFAVLGVGAVVGGGLTALVVVRLSGGVREIVERLDAVDKAAKSNLRRPRPQRSRSPRRLMNSRPMPRRSTSSSPRSS
jgi:hypothetical protein